MLESKRNNRTTREHTMCDHVTLKVKERLEPNVC